MAAAANALATRKELKDYLKQTGSNNTDDNLIQDLIGRVSTEIETYCDRKFTSQSYTEYYDGDRTILYTNQYPLTVVTSIYMDSSHEWAVDTLEDSDNYMIIDDMAIMMKGSSTFDDGYRAIKITYTAGYSTIPTDLKQVCIEEAGRKFKHRLDYDQTARTIGDGSVTYVEKGFLAKNKMVLEAYRRKAIA